MSLYDLDLELEPPFSDCVTDDELASLNIKDLNRLNQLTLTPLCTTCFTPTKGAFMNDVTQVEERGSE